MDKPDSSIRIVRLSQITQEALGLLQEYYEAVGVLVRDTPESVRKIAEDPDAGVWIAYTGGIAVGCVYLHGLPSIPFAAECKRLYVKPSARGVGVAERLLDALETFAASRGFKRIYLDSKDDLKVAIRLYTKRGFVRCERYNENPQATVFLVKNIEDKA
jgi:GNAT superfamily N-acetyltransferase